MKTTIVSVLTLLILINFTGCRRDKYIPNICYKEKIQPLLISKCGNTGCHNPTFKAAHYDLTSYDEVMKAVTPFHSGRSELYNSIKGKNPSMPTGSSKLTAAEVEMIKSWIDFGAANSSCGTTTCDTLSYLTYTKDIKPIMDLNCTGCHSSSLPSGGQILDSYSAVKASVNTGKFIPSIEQTGSFPMPQGGSKMATCDIRKIEIWINNGMPEN